MQVNPRIDLAKAIPLPAPFSIFLEPTNVCNFGCSICPESFADYAKQAGYYQRMTSATWDRVRASLMAWCRLKTIRFYHVGEPLLNQHLDRMIVEAKPFADRTELTTNGSLLNEAWAGRLLDAGLDYLRVSVYGTTDAEYQHHTGTDTRVDSIRENLRELRRQRDARGRTTPFLYADLVTQQGGQEEVFREQWRDIADETGVEAMHNWGASFVQLGQKAQKLICPFPFYEMVIKANGDVTVCCVDWDGKLTVGSVHDNTLREIWEGPRLQALRAAHLAGKRSDVPACRDCNALMLCPDNIDALLPA